LVAISSLFDQVKYLWNLWDVLYWAVKILIALTSSVNENEKNDNQKATNNAETSWLRNLEGKYE